jgi:hypothetical protein
MKFISLSELRLLIYDKNYINNNLILNFIIF